MPPDAPTRYKDAADLTPAEIFEDITARKRGEDAPQHETDAYRRYRNDVLRENGLEVDDEEEKEIDMETATPAEILSHIQRSR